jgi:hypothetical protein
MRTRYVRAASRYRPDYYYQAIKNRQNCEYRTTRVGHWTAGDLGGTPGFTF